MKPATQGVTLGLGSVAAGLVYFLFQQQLVHAASQVVSDPIAWIGRTRDPLFALMLWRQAQWLAAALLAAIVPAWLLSRIAGRWAALETLGGGAAALGLFLGSWQADPYSPFPVAYMLASAVSLTLCLPLEVYWFSRRRHAHT